MHIPAVPIPLDNDTLATLIALLGNADASKRAEAAIAASSIRHPDLVPIFAALLQDADATVRANAASGLGVNQATETRGALLLLLQDISEIVRERAITALAQIGTTDVIEPIIAMLEDRSGFVRNRAALVLGASKDARAIDPLVELLDSSDSATVGVALWALGALGARQALAPMRSLLNHKAAAVRANAAWALGSIGDPALISPLINMLNDKSAEVRANAALALGNLAEALGDARMEKALIRQLTDVAPLRNMGNLRVVAQAVAQALLQVGTATAQNAVMQWRPTEAQTVLPLVNRELIQQLARTPRDARDSVVQRLVDNADTAYGLIVEGLRARQASIRQGCAQALGMIGNPQAVEPLVVSLADLDSGVWSQCVAALARMPQAIVSLRQTLALTAHPQVKQGAALALWRLERNSEAFPYVLIALQQADIVVRGGALTALMRQPDERALATLQTLLTHEDTMMNRYVIQALQTIGTPVALGTIQHWWQATFGGEA